jgi:hypothetical protein
MDNSDVEGYSPNFIIGSLISIVIAGMNVYMNFDDDDDDDDDEVEFTMAWP